MFVRNQNVILYITKINYRKKKDILPCSKYLELNALFCGNSRKYRGENKNGFYKLPPPLTDIIVKYVFELRRTYPILSISSLMYCFAAIAGSIREKTKWILQGPPLMDILVKYVFQLRRNTGGGKKFYQHTVTLMIHLPPTTTLCGLTIKHTVLVFFFFL